MGNFLAVLPTPGATGAAEDRLRAGLETAARLSMPGARRASSGSGDGAPADASAPGSRATGLRSDWALVAPLPRPDGGGATLVRDPDTGSWLLAVGNWLHRRAPSGNDDGASFLLRRLLEDGPESLAEALEGFFVILGGDGRSRDVAVITDRVGSCHCYQRRFDDGVALAGSSLLLAALDPRPPLDPVGCQEFLYGATIYEDRTAFLGIRKLGPARIARFTAGAAGPEATYWSAAAAAPYRLSGRRAVLRLGDALTSGARRLHRRFGDTVCDLTGGYDSRAVVAAYLAADLHPACTVTGDEDSADVRISRRLARVAGIPHRHQPRRREADLDDLRETLAFTDGEYDAFEYARILAVQRALAPEFDAGVNGSFGELARGYWWELLTPRTGHPRPLDAARVAARRYAVEPHDADLVPAENRIDLTEQMAGVVGRAIDGIRDRPNTLQLDVSYLRLRMQRWQGRIASATNRLWAAQSLFMLRSILEPTLTVAPRDRKRNRLMRRLLVELAPELAAVPLESGHPAEPPSWRNLHRYLPALGTLAKKAAAKARRGLGLGDPAPDGTEPDRLRLWRDPEVSDLLDPGTMVLGELLDRDRTRRFLERSRDPAFPYSGQWNRMLTLELALRELASAAHLDD